MLILVRSQYYNGTTHYIAQLHKFDVKRTISLYYIDYIYLYSKGHATNVPFSFYWPFYDCTLLDGTPLSRVQGPGKANLTE